MKEYNYVIANNSGNTAETYKVMADSDKEAKKKLIIEFIKNCDIDLFNSFIGILQDEDYCIYEVVNKHE